MDSDLEAFYRQFTESFDRNMIAEKAEQFLKQKASHIGATSVLDNYPGGLIGFTFRKLLLKLTDSLSLSELEALVDRLTLFYGFPADWVPPRLLIREALALTVQRQRIIERPKIELNKPVDAANSVLDSAATTIQSAECAFLLDDDRTDVILNEAQSNSLDSGVEMSD